MRNYIKAGFMACAMLAGASCSATVPETDTGINRPEREFWLGADISGTTLEESKGVVYKDKYGKPTEITRQMKDYGLNAVRLRVWVNPEGGWSSKEDVLEMAKRAKALGMEIMIDFHYSDWWADPGKQNIPAQWKDYDVNRMMKALAGHTEETLSFLKTNGIYVKWVQVGNETRDGFLWPMGQLSKGNMANYAALSRAGYDAVKRVYPKAEVIVHLDNGFDNDVYNYVFDGLAGYGAKWDIIGMSVYPFWAIQGGQEPDEDATLRDAIANIKKLNKKYGCKIMIVETGVESEKPEAGLNFMNKLFDAAIDDTDGACSGVFYWAPEAQVTVDKDGNKSGYALGAFANDRPTVIMDSYPRAAEKLKKGSAK